MREREIVCEREKVKEKKRQRKIYIHIYRKRQRETDRERARDRQSRIGKWKRKINRGKKEPSNGITNTLSLKFMTKMFLFLWSEPDHPKYLDKKGQNGHRSDEQRLPVKADHADQDLREAVPHLRSEIGESLLCNHKRIIYTYQGYQFIIHTY